MQSGSQGAGSAFGLGAWRERVGAAFMRFEMEAPPRGSFIGSLAQATLGPLRLYDFTASAHAARRRPDSAPAGDMAAILAVTQVEGACCYTDATTTLTLGPGDVLFVRPGLRFDMHFPHDMRLRVVAMPAPLLAHGPLGHGRCASTVARAGTGTTAIGQALLDGVYAQAARLSGIEQRRMARLLVDMFELLAGVALAHTGNGGQGTRAAQLTRVLASVREQLADPDLDARTVASALGISPRYVRELLHAQGTNFRRLVLEQRLDRCREDLLDPLQRHRPVSDIAFGWGFNSAAHFTRVFRARYGLPPASLRQRHASAATSAGVA